MTTEYAQVWLKEDIVLLSLSSLNDAIAQKISSPQTLGPPQGAPEKIYTLFIVASEKCRVDFQRYPVVFELLKTNTPDINIA